MIYKESKLAKSYQAREVNWKPKGTRKGVYVEVIYHPVTQDDQITYYYEIWGTFDDNSTKLLGHFITKKQAISSKKYIYLCRLWNKYFRHTFC